jgi:hypothetical protein
MAAADLRAQVVAEARSWKGTHVRRGGRQKGIEADCVGVAMLTGVALGVLTEPEWAALAKEGKYGLLPNPRHLEEALRSCMLPVARADALPGDVCRFELSPGSGGMHLGVLAWFENRLTIIHASGEQPTNVLEVTFSTIWTRLAVDFWRYPGLA